MTNQKLLWKQKSLRDDGRNFDSSPLDQSDEAELVKEVREARLSLIEQVRFSMLNLLNILKDPSLWYLFHCVPLLSQVADLDDQFAELLLTDFSDNFDAIPSSKVGFRVLGLNTGRGNKKNKKNFACVSSAAGGYTAGDSRSQRCSRSLWELIEKQRCSASFRRHSNLPASPE